MAADGRTTKFEPKTPSYCPLHDVRMNTKPLGEVLIEDRGEEEATQGTTRFPSSVTRR
jgi:hypothetical protein